MITVSAAIGESAVPATSAEWWFVKVVSGWYGGEGVKF
jgi:hypothetical protein